MKTNLSRVDKLIDKTLKILNGKMPKFKDSCKYCKWN